MILIASFIFVALETVIAASEPSTFANLYLPFGVPIPEARVAVFFTSPYRDYSRHLNYRHTFDVTALNYVAKQLIAEGRIDDRLVIFSYHDTPGRDEPDSIRWTKEDNCRVFTDISNAFASKRMPPCYYVEVGYTGGVLSYDSLFFLLLTTEWPERHFRQAEQEGAHLEGVKFSRDPLGYRESYASEIEKYGGMQQTGFPVWSPDGKYLLQIRWQAYLGEDAGEIDTMSYEIVDRETGQVMKPPRENVSAFAVWSPNSRYVVSVRPHEITIFDLVTNQVKVIDQNVLLGEKVSVEGEADYSFDFFDGRLFFTRDTAHFSHPQTYVWDSFTDQVTWYKDHGPGPGISIEQRWERKENEFRLRQQKTFSVQLDKIAYTTTTDAGLMTVKITENLPPSPPKVTEARPVEAGVTSVKPSEVTRSPPPENSKDPAVAAAPALNRWEQRSNVLRWLTFTMAVESAILLVLMALYLRRRKVTPG